MWKLDNVYIIRTITTFCTLAVTYCINKSIVGNVKIQLFDSSHIAVAKQRISRYSARDVFCERAQIRHLIDRIVVHDLLLVFYKNLLENHGQSIYRVLNVNNINISYR